MYPKVHFDSIHEVHEERASVADEAESKRGGTDVDGCWFFLFFFFRLAFPVFLSTVALRFPSVSLSFSILRVQRPSCRSHGARVVSSFSLSLSRTPVATWRASHEFFIKLTSRIKEPATLAVRGIESWSREEAEEEVQRQLLSHIRSRASVRERKGGDAGLSFLSFRSQIKRNFIFLH